MIELCGLAKQRELEFFEGEHDEGGMTNLSLGGSVTRHRHGLVPRHRCGSGPDPRTPVLYISLLGSDREKVSATGSLSDP